MTIGKQNDHTKVIYTLNKEETIHKLENVDQEKDIGVIIDSNLEFDKHINAKINKANSMYSIIRRSFQFQQNFIPQYTSLVRSHLDYASSVWSPYKQKHIDTLENIIRYYRYIDINYYYLPRHRRPGTGDIATPPVCPSVTFSFRTVTQKRIDVFSRNFAGTCTMSWGYAV